MVNLASSTQRVSGELSISQSNVVCHLHNLSKSNQSFKIVSHVTKIFQNIWLSIELVHLHFCCFVWSECKIFFICFECVKKIFVWGFKKNLTHSVHSPQKKSVVTHLQTRRFFFFLTLYRTRKFWCICILVCPFCYQSFLD